MSTESASLLVNQLVIALAIIWLLFVLALVIAVTIKSYKKAPKRIKPLPTPVQMSQFPRVYIDRVCEKHAQSRRRMRRMAVLDPDKCEICAQIKKLTVVDN